MSLDTNCFLISVEAKKDIFINVYTALKLARMNEQDGVPETVEDDEEGEDEGEEEDGED